MKDKALVVLSGGQDSTTCLHHAIHMYGVENVSAIAFDYGQTHRIELESARRIADMCNVKLETVNIVGMLQSTSPLTSDTPLDKYESFEQMEAEVGDKVEKTFVPMRNTLFLTLAFNRAVVLGCNHVVTGVCQQDNANYPDCTEDFIAFTEQSLNESLGYIKHTSGGCSTPKDHYISIDTPLMYLSKAQTVAAAMELPGCMRSLAYSHTSYDGKYPPTDPNHSNILRAQGFLEAGYPDPLVVRAVCEGLMPKPDTANYADDKFLLMTLAIGVTDMRAPVAVGKPKAGPQAYTVTNTRTLRGEDFAKAGDTVYAFMGCDYGLASDDSRGTGFEHRSVTVDPTGKGPFFTIPVAHLLPIAG